MIHPFKTIHMNHIRVFCFVCVCLFCQSRRLNAQSISIDSVFAIVDVPPQFPGGAEKLTAFVSNNIARTVRNKLKNDKERRIFHIPIQASFLVEKDGTLSNISVKKDSMFRFGEEALHILHQMPKWSPGMKDGHLVRAQVNLPISLYMGINFENNSSLDYIESGNNDFSLTYLKPFFSGNIGRNLESNIGVSLEWQFIYSETYVNKYPKHYRNGLGVYYRWIRASVIHDFERRQSTWKTGRISSLNEIGIDWSAQYFPFRHLELVSTFQAGPIWHRAVKKLAEDTGLGIGTAGFSAGFGINANWHFAKTTNGNYHVITFRLLGQHLFMASPLKGNISSIGIGYLFCLT